MTEIGINLSVRDANNNVYPKYFGYEFIDEALKAFKDFCQKKVLNEPIRNNLGNFYIEGDIALIVS